MTADAFSHQKEILLANKGESIYDMRVAPKTYVHSFDEAERASWF